MLMGSDYSFSLHKFLIDNSNYILVHKLYSTSSTVAIFIKYKIQIRQHQQQQLQFLLSIILFHI